MKFKSVRHLALAVVVVLPAISGLAGCTTEQVMRHGAIINSDQLDLIPVGSSRDQVLLALGSPSTTGQFKTEVFYYISQTKVKRYTYQKSRVTEQQVLSVYFDDANTVNRVAKYGLQDGRVFDFISRTTPTGGKDYTFLTQLLTGRASPNSALGTSTQGVPGL
ncbi:MAG: outer membrane protein assembly factor BamE [Rhizobiaceae bacterium]|nr:outer membrane protein assembly factor BamE [Rhizobiaceae bacterium]